MHLLELTCRVEIGLWIEARNENETAQKSPSISLAFSKTTDQYDYRACGAAARISHAFPETLMAASSCCISPSSSRILSVLAASSASIRLMAKPTWTSTQSPTHLSTGWS